MPGLKDLIVRLHQGEVELVLAGGVGVVAHGSSLVTLELEAIREKLGQEKPNPLET